MISAVTAEFPHLKVVATTLRTVRTASVNDWGAVAWSSGEFAEATHRPGLEILDRVGGGGFASGLVYGLLNLGDLQTAVEYGAAHGALAMTTPGDTSMASPLPRWRRSHAARAPASNGELRGVTPAEPW